MGGGVGKEGLGSWQAISESFSYNLTDPCLLTLKDPHVSPTASSHQSSETKWALLQRSSASEACLGMLRLGSGEVREVSQYQIREAGRQWRALAEWGTGTHPFSGSLNEHIHSLSQASISNSSASLPCGIVSPPLYEIQKQGWVSNS